MNRLRVGDAWLAAGLFALAALFCVPLGLDARSLLAAADDPVAISDRALARAFDASVVGREIDRALQVNDVDLARSFVELAQDRGVAVPPEMAQQVRAAVAHANSAAGAAESFARGLITGEPDDMAGLAGTTLGDLFVFGDIRDAAREGSRYVSGGSYDEVILGLACVGIAVTAGTYATLGASTPVRVGLSAVKVARKSGRIEARMANWIGRSLRDAIDWTALRRAGSSLAEPAVAVRIARETVKVEKADGVVRLVGDVGRVQSRAGIQAALDGLKLAQGPRDMARIAKLAEKNGGKTRAILKTLGRGAIVLSVASFNLVFWVLGAIFTLLGLVVSAKSAIERTTLRHLQRKKRQRYERYAATMGLRA